MNFKITPKILQLGHKIPILGLQVTKSQDVKNFLEKLYPIGQPDGIWLEIWGVIAVFVTRNCQKS